MRKAIILVLLVFFGFGLRLVAQENPATAPDLPESTQTTVQAELRPVVEQYFAAYQKKDLEAMMALWSSHSPNVASTREAAARFLEANDNLAVAQLAVGQATFDGQTKARLRVSMEIEATDAKTRKAVAGLGKAVYLFDLVKETGGWRLWQEIDTTEQLADELVTMASEKDRAPLLEREKDSVGPGLVQALIARGDKLRRRGDLAKASDIFLLSGHLAEKLGDDAGLSASYRNRGVVYGWKGDHRQAEEWCRRSLDIAQKLQDPLLIANALCDLGIQQAALGELSSARASYKKGLEMAELTHDDQIMARLLGNMANLLQGDAEFAQAEDYYLRALEIQERLGNNPQLWAGILLNLGVLEYNQNSYARAMAYYQRAIPIAEKGNYLSILPYALTDIGNLLAEQDNYKAAMDYFKKSLAVSKKLGTKDTIRLSLENIGHAEMSANKLTAALKNFTESLDIARQSGDKPSTDTLEGEIGEVYMRRGDYKTALVWEQKALALADELRYPYEAGEYQCFLSVIYRHLGRLDKAVELAERASQVGRKIGNRWLIASAGAEASAAYRAMGHTLRARQTLQEAIDATESMRFDAGSEQQRQRFLETRIGPYQEMVTLLISQNQVAEALAFAERAKARTLLEVLQGGKVRYAKSMTDTERNQEQALEAALVSLNRQIQEAEGDASPDNQRLDSLKSRREQTRTRYEQFQAALYGAHPELKTERGQVSPITLDQTAELLRDDRSALLEFSVGEKRSYLFVITRKSGSTTPQMRVYPLQARASDLTKSAEKFRRVLAERGPDFQVLAKQLYELLLVPAQKQLAGKDMLIVVPDGALWSLPFQALVPKEGRYLVEQYAIAYAPSLTVLREMERIHKNFEPAKEPSQAATLLAMADPVLGQQTLAHASFAYRGEKLGPLPDARREVQALKQYYPGSESEIDVGEEAREDRFKAQAGKFRILHLASHGVLDNASPMYSNILLSPGDSGSEDGLLEAREIMQMDLHANLVILSACETARGHIAPGEGVIGLTWAFFLAGTPTMVVSQWRVESASTAALMLSFHRSLNPVRSGGIAGVSVARALQKAEIQTLRKPGYAHPFYWAGFVVMGDPGVMTTR